MTIKVLFVCTANLCRSPMAEGVFRTLAERAGVADSFEIASAGTSDGFVGRSPMPEAIEVTASRGYDISGIVSRQMVSDDIAHFDYPLAMDSSHLVAMRWLSPRSLVGKPKLFMSYGPPLGIVDVADPMGGPKDGFERALSLIEAGCKGLFEKLAPMVKKAI
ncbi:MAG: low molecular weight protein-tyrosine-phosphatase [Alphaproteobacteria bacterium]|jgi:protein-tyrosine phosphatase